jgi:membrane fusion protein, multidrug efflux system
MASRKSVILALNPTDSESKKVLPGSKSAGLILAIGLASLAFVSCSSNQAKGTTAYPPTPVEASDVTVGTVTDRFEAVGTIDAINSITVVSEIDALVRELPFQEGAAIQKGELIAQLDDRQLQAQLTRAQALRDQKKTNFERVNGLAGKGAVPQQQLDDASSELKVAEADVAVIQAQMARTRIVAPFSGTTGARRVSPGALVRAGTAITDLAQLDQLKVTFAAPERYYSTLKLGAKVTISTTAYPGYELVGTIKVIEPMVDQATRSARVIAHVANPDMKFRPGMSANVSAILSERYNALMIPDEAVFAEGNQSLVFVVKPDSTVIRVPVILGSRQPETVEVLKGLQSGMKVVRAGHQKLYEGAKVMPVPSAAQANAGDSTGGTR